MTEFGVFSAVIVAFCLGFTFGICRILLAHQADLLDRVQEMTGTIHQYQVDVNRGARLGAEQLQDPVGQRSLYTSEDEEDAIASARRADGTIDQDELARLLADANFDNTEIQVEP